MLGDDIVDNKKPCLKQMMEVYSQYKTSILGVQQVPQSDVCKYGIVDGRLVEDRIYKVRELVEKLSVEEAPSNLAIVGRYVITPAIFEILERTSPGTDNQERRRSITSPGSPRSHVRSFFDCSFFIRLINT